MRNRSALRWLALAVMVLAACGTRLPDSAFVAAGQDVGSGGPNGPGGTSTTLAGGPGSTVAGGPGATTPGGGPVVTTPGGGPGSVPEGPNQASDVGVTETSITIGNITAVDGVLGNAFEPTLLGLQTWVNWVNDHGGIHGRTIKLEACNDKEDKTRNLQCAQDLVQNKQVFAFVANNSRMEGGGAGYINSAGVPAMGDFPITQASNRFEHFWSVYGSGCPRDNVHVCGIDKVSSTSGIPRWFHEHTQTTKAAVFYYGLIGESAQAGAFVKKGLELEGYEVTPYDINFANPDFNQPVQDMQRRGIQLIYDVMDDGANRKLCDAMQTYNFKVTAKISTIVSMGDSIGTDFSDVCRDTIYISGSTVAYTQTSNPEVKLFRDAFANYQPGRELHEWALEGWMAGRQFGEALAAMGPAPTRKGIEAWLAALKGYTYNGLTSPLDYQLNDITQPTANDDCFTIAQWQDSAGGWVQRTNPYDCYDNVHQYLTPVSERGD